MENGAYSTCAASLEQYRLKPQVFSAPMSTPRILIIGAGFAGLGAAIALKRAGFHSLTVIDRGAEVGGTWRDNTYPGCACDVPSHLYSFSFDSGFDWDRPYAGQAQIFDYLKRLADRHGVRPHLRLNTEVRRASWVDERRVWQLELGDGGVLEGEVLVSGVGGLVRPSLPAIDGVESFEGAAFHSARWRHDVDLAGKRVALIGTGASAVQIGPEVAKVAQHLHVFQRTPPWVMPRRDTPYGPLRRWLYRHVPGLTRLDRWRIYALHELATVGFLGSAPSQRAVRWLMARVASRHLRRQVADPALRSRLTPRDAPGCKRIVLSDAWYPTLARSNVSLVTEAIERIVPEGVVTSDGQVHAVDVLIFGTGFSVSGALSRTHGRQGVKLGESWARHGAQTHLGLAARGFPNHFMLLGPGTGLGSNSVVFMLEAQLNYLVQALRFLARSNKVVEVRADVQAAGDAERQQRLRHTVWASGCQSWYRSASGRIDTLWPDFSFNYWRRTRRFDARVYEVEGGLASRDAPAAKATEP